MRHSLTDVQELRAFIADLRDVLASLGEHDTAKCLDDLLTGAFTTSGEFLGEVGTTFERTRSRVRAVCSWMKYREFGAAIQAVHDAWGGRG